MAKQLNGLIIIFAALYGGVSLQAIWLHSIPGPVLGMALLLAYLLWHRGEPYGLNAAAQWFISTLSLLFIPAAVGIWFLDDEIIQQWPAILIATIPATLLTQVWVALLMQKLLQLKQPL